MDIAYSSHILEVQLGHSLLLTSSPHCHLGQKCDAIGYKQNLSFSHHEVVALLIGLPHCHEY